MGLSPLPWEYPEPESCPSSPHPPDVDHGAWALGHKLCSIMVKQEQSPEPPVDALAASSAMAAAAAAAAMATTPLLGLSPLSRLPMPPQVSLGMSWGGRRVPGMIRGRGDTVESSSGP